VELKPYVRNRLCALHKIAASFVQLFDDCHSAHQIEQQNYLDLLDRLDAWTGAS
jgi:hypothetical protein